MSVDNDNSSSNSIDNLNATTTISNEPQVGDIAYIDNATLLQVDITAIVGIFIFLTIQQLTSGARVWSFVTAFLVIPFTVSAIAILIESIWASEYLIKVVQQNVNIPGVSALTGFFYILIIFVYIFHKTRSKKV